MHQAVFAALGFENKDSSSVGTLDRGIHEETSLQGTRWPRKAVESDNGEHDCGSGAKC